MDALDLRLAVADRLGRNDFSDLWPSFLAGAAARLNAALRTNEMLKTVALTFVDGAATLPNDFLEVLEVRDGRGVAQSASVPGLAARSGSQYGWYSIIGNEMRIFTPTGTRTMIYYAELPPLVGVAGTNWLLSKEPSAYREACIVEAAQHFGDAERMAAAQEALGVVFKRLKISDERTRFAGARVYLQGPTP